MLLDFASSEDCWTAGYSWCMAHLAAKVELLYAQEATERCASVLDLEANALRISANCTVSPHLQSAKRRRNRWTFSAFDQTSATYLVEFLGLFRVLQVRFSPLWVRLIRLKGTKNWHCEWISGCKFTLKHDWYVCRGCMMLNAHNETLG